MRELLADDGQADRDAFHLGVGEGSADGQAVDEIVQAVAEDDHPGYWCNAVEALEVVVTVAVVVLACLLVVCLKRKERTVFKILFS